MSSKADWMETTHEGLYFQSSVAIDYLTPETLERIGLSAVAIAWYNSEVIVRYNKFKLAFEKWKNPAERTPLKYAVLFDAEADFRKIFRKLYSGYIKNNPLVSNDDLVNMRMPKHYTGKRTAPSIPTTLVKAMTDTSFQSILIIHYSDKNRRGSAKPKGIYGAEIVWAMLDAPPASIEQLTNNLISTRTPAQIVFSNEQRGKIVYFAIRWINSVGEKGPYGNIYSSIIP